MIKRWMLGALIALLIFSGCKPSATTKPTSMKANPVTVFEIPVVNMPRAISFYEDVFQIKLEQEMVDGNVIAWFPHNPLATGASGALAQGDSYQPSTAGTRIYFSVADPAAVLARAQARGSQVLYPLTEVSGYGWVAELTDSEGNRIALHRPDSTSQSTAPNLHN